MSGHQPPRGGNRGRYGRNTPDPSRRPYNQPQHQQNNNAPNQQPHYPGYVHFNQYQPPTNSQYYGTGYEGFTTQPAAVNPSMYPPQQQQYNEPGYPGYAGQYVSQCLILMATTYTLNSPSIISNSRMLTQWAFRVHTLEAIKETPQEPTILTLVRCSSSPVILQILQVTT
jgi:hypothetical protein